MPCCLALQSSRRAPGRQHLAAPPRLPPATILRLRRGCCYCGRQRQDAEPVTAMCTAFLPNQIVTLLADICHASTCFSVYVFLNTHPNQSPLPMRVASDDGYVGSLPTRRNRLPFFGRGWFRAAKWLFSKVVCPSTQLVLQSFRFWRIPLPSVDAWHTPATIVRLRFCAT